MCLHKICPAAYALGIALFWTGSASAMPTFFRVTFENLAPAQGTLLTPLWFGVHAGEPAQGGFDLYDLGSPASMALERLAEDGDPAPLVTAFDAGNTAGRFVDGVLFGPGVGPGSPPIFGPGGIASIDISYDFGPSPMAYFSYASMVIPSNDAFIGNGNPLGIPLFDLGGNFLGADFIVLGSAVRDAGTEVNDEIPANTAALGQTVPNTGVNENGVVSIHPGFLPGGNILAAIPSGDFTQDGYQVARIRVERIPEPAPWWLMGAGLVALGLRHLTVKTD
jgi:hypothetical protein